MDLRLELVTVPVSDVDCAKAFYVGQVGFSVEQDVQIDDDHRFVELMPPGSRKRGPAGVGNEHGPDADPRWQTSRLQRYD